MNAVLGKSACVMAALSFTLLVATSGCGKKEDLNKAKTVVETALTSWKNGETADKLVSQGIHFADDDQKAGNKLLDFTIKNVSSQPQQGPRVVVLLKMQRRNGKKQDSEIGYEVRLADKVHIGRDPFHIP